MEFAKILQVPFYLFEGSVACIKSQEYLPRGLHILLQVGMENLVFSSSEMEVHCRVFVPVSTKEHNIV